MATLFNADEVFAVAEQIERNGAKFYRKAGENFKAPELQRKMNDLAAMELSHEKIFAAMRAELKGRALEPSAFDPEGRAQAYLQAFADGHVFDVKADPSAKLSGKESLKDVLLTAIGLEKDSVVFYTGIREVVPENLGRDKIDRIIREEMNHITMLSKELAAAK